MTSLCVADDCVVHTSACRDSGGEDCVCHPALAAPGLLVCAHHADRPRDQLRDLPGLWAVLGAKPGAGGAVGPGELSQPLSDHARDARSAVKAMLVLWCRVLEEDRGSPLPDEQVIAARAREQALRHQWDADVALRAWRRAGDPLPHIAIVAAPRRALLDQYYRHRASADAMREAREDGSDVIEALREHVDRHLSWLLANPEHADQLVHDVAFAWSAARACVRSAPIGVPVECKCGERVRLDADSGDPDKIFTCVCGEWGTLSWWWEQVAPRLGDGPLPLSDLPQWLATNHDLVVGWEQLRNWARSDRSPRLVPVEEARRDEAGRFCPALYDPEDVLTLALARQVSLRTRRTG
jgi:hypothetical protein